MSSIQTALRRTISRAMAKRRLNIHDAPKKEQFAQRCKVLGLNAPWEDYARARAQISCNLDEYFAFELFGKDGKLRDSYLTMDRQEEIVNKIGDVYVALAIPGNKVLFDAYFDDFLKREWINPTDCTADRFLAFVKKHGRVIIKPAALYSGKGITLHRYESDRETLKTYDALYGAGVVVEQLLIQHEQMNRLNPDCVNSVRILTYTDRDNVHMLCRGAFGGGRGHCGQLWFRWHVGGRWDSCKPVCSPPTALIRISGVSPGIPLRVRCSRASRCPTGTRRWRSPSAPPAGLIRCPSAAGWAGIWRSSRMATWLFSKATGGRVRWRRTHTKKAFTASF